jgi:hypothetical protein
MVGGGGKTSANSLLVKLTGQRNSERDIQIAQRRAGPSCGQSHDNVCLAAVKGVHAIRQD